MIFMHTKQNVYITLIKQKGSRTRKSKRGLWSKGFTIIELLIIFAILAVLSTIALFSYTQLIDKARYVNTVEDIWNIASLLDSYYIEKNAYPNTLNEIGVGSLQDPWGNPYQYLDFAITDKNDCRKDGNDHPINSFYDLWSNGENGEYKERVDSKEGRDDIIRAWDGAFIGYAKEFHDMQKAKEDKDKPEKDKDK